MYPWAIMRNRLVNLGLGHWAIDGGVGYTYFDSHAGNEFSFVTNTTTPRTVI
jgi:hypothetical protein